MMSESLDCGLLRYCSYLFIMLAPLITSYPLEHRQASLKSSLSAVGSSCYSSSIPWDVDAITTPSTIINNSLSNSSRYMVVLRLLFAGFVLLDSSGSIHIDRPATPPLMGKGHV